MGKYDIVNGKANDHWIGMDNNAEEWAVGFHGTKLGAVKSILGLNAN